MEKIEVIEKTRMEQLLQDIKDILTTKRRKAYTEVNYAMVECYWLIGKRIVEHEQNGNQRAEYGKRVLKTLADQLTKEFGKGFEESNLRYMRLFYTTFQNCDTLRHELTWSHYRRLRDICNLHH